MPETSAILIDGDAAAARNRLRMWGSGIRYGLQTVCKGGG
jgi:hypothetical protein